MAAATVVAAACCPCPPVTPGAQSATGTPGTAAGTTASAEYSWSNVTILGGGFVTGVIFSRAEQDLIYARTDIGGAYRYRPADGAWIPITDHLPRAQSNFMGVESLAADPVDADRVYLAVGTYTQSWAGNGAMMRSTDRGETWELAEMPFKMGGNENGRANGERMAVDPNDNRIVLFGSRKNGLWRTPDSGATWDQVDEFPVTNEPLGVGITFVTFDAKSGQQGKPTPVIYAGVASTEVGLYRSGDAGQSWKPVAGQPKGVMPSHGELDPDGVLYLSYGNQPGPSGVRDGAIWKYEAKGDRWTDITPAKPGGEDKFGYGGLSVGASQAGTVMVTTLDRWGPGDEIFRTTDGGKTWAALGKQAVRDDDGAKYLYWGRGPEKISATGWMGDLDLDPHRPGRAMYVTGQGIWASDDVTAADTDQPTHWKFTNRGLEETAVTDLASPPTGPQLLSVMGDICGFRHDQLDQPPAGGMFANPIFGGGSGIDFAERRPEVVVRVGSHDQGQYGAYSSDAGMNWKPFASVPEGADGGGDVAVTADGRSIVWAPKSAGPSYSRDQGKTWARCDGLPGASKLPDWAPVNFRLAADRVSAQKVYVYDATTGKAFVSGDAGKSFKPSPTGLPALADYELPAASAIAVPGQEGHVWVTTGKGLYRSSDSGESFELVDGTTEARAVGFGKAAEGADYPAVYFVGKVNEVDGIFRSVDGGATFIQINDDRHRFAGAGVMTGDPRVFGRVYIGTHGRGIILGEPK